MARVLRHFAEELQTLTQRLLAMGGLAEERVRLAMDALVRRDPVVINEVIAGDGPINELHVEVDERCLTLLALHQPMAVDLRKVTAAVKINSDLERVGDLAVNIAEAAQRYISHPPVKTLIDLPAWATWLSKCFGRRWMRSCYRTLARRRPSCSRTICSTG